MSNGNEIDKEYFEELKTRVRHNYQIADFYLDRYERDGEIKFLNKSKAINVCCKFWDIDSYLKLKVKDIKRVNLCRDKFCFNCQSNMALERQARFAPQLDEYRKDYEVFHLVLTVPNCSGNELPSVIDKMFQKFPYMIRYFNGIKKVKNVDFLAYGYAGAVRGVEVTQNQTTKEFHPHFHCMVLFRKGLKLEKTIVNPYSFDGGFISKKFSALEILLQKIWYLLLNNERVTAKAIEELKLGYDVQMSDSEGYYHEAFKYACKGAFDESKGAFLYNEQTFWTLYEALHNRRMIQGYGLLYNFDECEDILKLEADLRYEQIIYTLRELEKPTFRIENLDEIIEKVSSWRYISKGNLKRFLEGKRAEIEAKHILLAEGVENFFEDPEQISIFEKEEENK
ncbi:MAG: protein rep [Clostridia bacterium]|nr:protein rep [Clostridia bacterium]